MMKKTGFEAIYARYNPPSVWTFPIVFVFNSDYEVDLLNLCPGRFTDGPNAMNGVCGFRVYKGVYAAIDGWNPISLPTPRTADLVWVQPCDQRQAIPWFGKVQGAVEIHAASGIPTISGASVEFVLRGYTER